jgi:hypothetical protein
METQCLARAKLVYIKKLSVYQLKVAFNVRETNARGHYIFPVQKKCAFVSGHIPYNCLEKDLPRVVAQAKMQLRTNNIEFI